MTRGCASVEAAAASSSSSAAAATIASRHPDTRTLSQQQQSIFRGEHNRTGLAAQCGQVDSDGGDKYLAAAENSEAGPRPVVRLLSCQSAHAHSCGQAAGVCGQWAVEGTG